MNILIMLAALYGGDDKQFFNRENGFVIAEQRERQVTFYDPILEAEMKENGVVIPPDSQKKYGGRERIKFGEEGFFEAFYEFYTPYCYSDNCQWKKLDS